MLGAAALLGAHLGGAGLGATTGAGRAPAPWERAGSDTTPDPREVRQQVCDLLAPPADASFDATLVAERIAALGPAAIDPCLSLLLGEVEPPEFAAGTTDGALHPDAIAQREPTLRLALTHFEVGLLVTRLTARAELTGLHGRLVIVSLLGTAEHPRSLAAILELTASIEDIHLHRDYVTQPIERALAARLAARPREAWTLLERARQSSGGLRALLVRTLAKGPSGPSLEALEACSGLDAELDAFILRALAQRSTSGLYTPSELALGRARARCESASTELRLAAFEFVAAFGGLEDARAFLGRIDDPDLRTAQAARRCLRSMSGVDFGGDAARWGRWLDDETSWIEEHLEERLERIAGDDDALAVAASKDLSRHPFALRACASELAGLLSSDLSNAVAAALCETLARLPRGEFAPRLVAELAHEDPERRDAAWRILRTLTARSEPPEREVWERALFDRVSG